MNRKTYGLSKPACEGLESFKRTMASLFPLRHPDGASASVSIEFLLWWWHQTRGLEFDGKPSHRRFSPETKLGRPGSGIDTHPIPPSRLREGTGLDSVVQKRKLR